MSNLYWNEPLIRKYDLQGPRYTSYPTAVEFQNGFCTEDIAAAAHESRLADRLLSLYLHIPFCAKLCYYCACNKIVTKRREKVQPYLEDLVKELDLLIPLYGEERTVDQLHFGGGTPTFLNDEEMRWMFERIRERFRLSAEGDFSIEIDPRTVSLSSLETLRTLGFNRISLGVQDFEPAVQKAVNRVQSPEETLALLNEARRLGFRSINIDLIYGLPFQTVDSFRRTLDTIIQFSPDRLSVFNYAHLPQRFQPQQRIREDDLPPPETKLRILQNAIDQLVGTGYHFVGMDHFAKPDDALAIAQKQGKLHRNFQGYTTHGDCDLLAVGVSAISMTPDATYQNVLDLETYHHRLSLGRLPTHRGFRLSEDDRIRRDVIMELICQFRLTKSMIETRHHIDFDTYFSKELQALADLHRDGLVSLSEEAIQVNPPGRLLIRAICKIFDSYRQPAEVSRFSRII